MDSNYHFEGCDQSFDFGASGQAGQVAVYQSSDERWYTVLGVDPGASPRQVRSAYLAAIRAYHPDLVAMLGPKIRQVAAIETRRIIRAYEEAKMSSASQR